MFLSTLKASDDRSPYGNFWFQPVSMRGASGARVNADTAMSLSAVWRAVRLVSGQFSVCPFVIYKKGTKKRVTDHYLCKLFGRRPNKYQNAFEWREMLCGHLELRGNAFNQIVVNGRGIIEQLVPLHPDRVKLELLQSGEYRYRYVNQFGIERVFAREEIWHLRGFSSDGYMGLSTIQCARESLGVSLSAQEYAARFFANDAKPTSGWIEFPGNFKDKAAREVFKESVQSAHSGNNRGKVMVLEHNMKYHEVGLTNKDSQFIETRKFEVNEIARWFDVPPHKLADLERATFSNIEQQSQDFVQDCLIPRAERWEASIEAELLLDDEDLEVGFDFRNLLRGDSAARGIFYNSGINSGWLTRNEAREQENLEPIDGLDEPLRPLNMVEESDAETAPVPSSPRQPPRPTPDDENEADARLVALATTTAERVARKETAVLTQAMKGENASTKVAEAMEKHARFVAETLGVSMEAAVAYCATRVSDPIRDGHEEQDIFSAARTKLMALAMKGIV